MEKQLYPYQFNYIKERIAHLLNAYKSVNDLNTITSIKETTKEDIYQQFYQTDDTLIEVIEKLMNIRISKAQVDKILAILQTYVRPFEHPSKKQVEKTFRKIKKLKSPLISDEILLESTYIGWNDIASNRKFIIYYDEQGLLTGFYGDIANQTVKGYCAICNKESNVALFMRKPVLLVMDNIPKKVTTFVLTVLNVTNNCQTLHNFINSLIKYSHKFYI